MHLSTVLLTLTTLTSTLAVGVHNTSQEYRLKTAVKPNQPKKTRFNNLWLQGYHTGAGLNDVTFTTQEKGANKGFLEKTNVTGKDDRPFYSALFDLGSDFSYDLVMDEYDTMYAGWQPVRLNAGTGGSGTEVSGFFINSTGLQWTSTPEKPGSSDDAFGGWLVCDWWHGVPQLFFRLRYDHIPETLGCADVKLEPVYI